MADITAGSVKSKKKKKISIFPIVNCIIMVLFVIITLYPVLNTLAISLNDGTDALRGGIYLLPRKFTWKNYITVLQKNNLITGAYITVARTIIGTVLALVANAILAFIVSRKRFLFKRGLSLFWVITMYVNGGLIPVFLLYKGLGLTNSFWVWFRGRSEQLPFDACNGTKRSRCYRYGRCGRYVYGNIWSMKVQLVRLLCKDLMLDMKILHNGLTKGATGHEQNKNCEAVIAR